MGDIIQRALSLPQGFTSTQNGNVTNYMYRPPGVATPMPAATPVATKGKVSPYVPEGWVQPPDVKSIAGATRRAAGEGTRSDAEHLRMRHLAWDVVQGRPLPPEQREYLMQWQREPGDSGDRNQSAEGDWSTGREAARMRRLKGLPRLPPGREG